MSNFFNNYKTIEEGKFPYYLVQTHYNGCKNIDSIDLQDDKPKIICLGCSITYGVHLNPEDNLKIDNSYPKFLNYELSDSYNVLNMGIVGSGLKFQIEWFKFYYSTIKNIDTVILQVSDFQRQPMKPWQSDELQHHTYDFGSRILLKDFHKKDEESETFFKTIKHYTPCEIINVSEYCINMVNQDFTQKQFNLIIDFYDLLKSLNIKLVVLYYEYWDNFYQLKTLNIQYYSKIKNFCKVNNLKFVGKISTNELKADNLLLDDVHLNSNGNEFLAKKIKSYL